MKTTRRGMQWINSREEIIKLRRVHKNENGKSGKKIKVLFQLTSQIFFLQSMNFSSKKEEKYGLLVEFLCE